MADETPHKFKRIFPAHKTETICPLGPDGKPILPPEEVAKLDAAVVLNQMANDGRHTLTGLKSKTSTSTATPEQVRQTIANVFDRLGGEEFMLKWAERHDNEFFKLYGKLADAKAEALQAPDITIVTAVQRSPLDN